MSRKLTEKYHYILLSAKSSKTRPIDTLTIQQSLRSSLLQTCGQTASAHIDILSVVDGYGESPHNADAEVVIRISPSDKNNVLVAITTSGSDKNRLGFAVIRDSSFLPSLLPQINKTNL